MFETVSKLSEYGFNEYQAHIEQGFTKIEAALAADIALYEIMSKVVALISVKIFLKENLDNKS